MPETSSIRSPGLFGPTRWTLVVSAVRRDSAEGKAALAELCETYWYPLYAYVRRCGHDRPDAEDLTQEFFARLLAGNSLASASPEKGRFRSFLLASIKHFLANQWDRSQALKRGGGQTVFSLDVPAAENRHPLEPADYLTSEKAFERQWVMALLDRVLGRLEDEYRAGGKDAQFAALKVYLTGESDAGDMAKSAEKLGLSAGAHRVAAHRLRRRYRDLLRAEIAHTVEDPGEVDQEIQRLFSAFG